MEDQVLSIEQMNVLSKLGVDCSKASVEIGYIDFVEHYFDGDSSNIEFYICFFKPEGTKPTNLYSSYKSFTTHDLMMLLPDRITIKNNGDEEKDENYKLKITALALKHWAVEYESHNYPLIATYSTNLIDALFDMVVKCVKNGYIKTK